MFRTIMIVGIGGFAGSVMRYLGQMAIGKLIPTSFPLGTFVVNIIGCFAIGVIAALAEKGNILTSEMRLFLAVGICGGFTTFSTFANENFSLLKDNSIGLLLLNTVGSVVLGMFAVYLGIIVVKSIIG